MIRRHDAASVDERVRLVLEVVPGERALLPEFGWRGHFLQSLETTAERALAGVLAEEALRRWVPDLVIERVEVERVDGSDVDLRVETPVGRSVVRVAWRGPNASGATGEETTAAPSGETRAVAERHLDRARRLLRRAAPDWDGRPEDPISVALEVWAELLAELEESAATSREALLERSLASIGVEPREPVAARGLVRFEPSSELRGGRRVPALTRVATRRDRARSKTVFETSGDVWIGPQRIARAYAVADGRLTPLPADGLATSSPVIPFGESLEACRHLLLGDACFGRLRDRAELEVEWAEFRTDVTEGTWEYRGDGGWRRLSRRLELVEGDRLRLVAEGPLVDLHSDERGLGWLRLTVPAKGELTLVRPDVRDGEGGARPVSLALVEGAGAIVDLAYRGASRQVAGRPDDEDPYLLVGFDSVAPMSLGIELGEEQADGGDWSPRPPVLLWECSTGDGWRTIGSDALRDGTRGLRARGAVHMEPPDDAAAVELFGERLFWVRARWVDGAYARPPVIRGIRLGVGEVVQGVTKTALPIGVDAASFRDWIELPRFPDGEVVDCDRIVVVGPNAGDSAARRELFTRVDSLDGVPDGERCFVSRREADGGVSVSFDGGDAERSVPEADASCRVESLRVVKGGAGNLEEGALGSLETDDEALKRDVAAVRQLGATHGGLSSDPAARRGRRVAARLSGEDERAVTPDDYRRLVRLFDPRVTRVEARAADGARAGGPDVEVTVLPGDGRVGAVLWDSLERYLEDCSPPGTRVRVTEGTRLPAVLEVEIRRPSDAGEIDQDREAAAPVLEDFEAWAGAVLRSTFGGRVERVERVERIDASDSDREGERRDGAVALLPSESIRSNSIHSALAAALPGWQATHEGALGGIDLLRASLTAESPAARRRLEHALSRPASAVFVEVQRVAAIIGRPESGATRE